MSIWRCFFIHPPSQSPLALPVLCSVYFLTLLLTGGRWLRDIDTTKSGHWLCGITNSQAPKHLSTPAEDILCQEENILSHSFKDNFCMVLVETLHISINSLLKYVWIMCYDSHSLHDGWLSYLYSIKEVESFVFLVRFCFLRFYFFRAVLGLICFLHLLMIRCLTLNVKYVYTFYI